MAGDGAWALPRAALNVTHRPALRFQPESVPFEYDGVMLVETNAHDHLFMLAHRRDVVHDGFHMLVFDDAVVTWRDETTIRVEAPGLTEDELLDAAASLVPVARE